MAQTRCPACGATVEIAAIAPDNVKTVALEINPDANSEAPRYRVVDHGGGSGIGRRRMRVVRAVPGAVGDFRAEHAYDCPGGNAGRKRGER